MLLFSSAHAQQHHQSEQYTPPSNPLVQKKLKEWEGLKFGLLMHWGTYSQWGIVESWSICPEDEGWTQRNPKFGKNYFEYVKNYENLQTSFNPILFNPEKWASAAKEAGMRYMVFTTKHHDGFCMFDTKLTDYKITDEKTPFHTNPKANVAKEIFNAFREKNFMIGAYFSKPDWHSQNYWWSYFPPKNRNINYDNEKYPERWQAFKDYTYGQIKELMSQYGNMDILWLDGGWVRPKERKIIMEDGAKGIQYNQDIDMAKIAAMARTYNPGMLVVDRTVPGEYENYQTPEQTIPDKVLFHPWESCITLGDSWSYVPNDNYKSATKVIRTLLTIVARGGSLLLNIGPSPEGEWDEKAYTRLIEIGEWMKINAHAVYNTKPVAPYEKDGLFFTRSTLDNSKYVYLLAAEGNENVNIPSSMNVGPNFLTSKSKITVIGSGVTIKKFNATTGDITIDTKDKNKITFNKHALILKIIN